VCPPVVCDVVGGAARTAARDAALVTFDAFVGWLADGARWVLTQVFVLMGDSTRIDLGVGWFSHHEQTMQKLAVMVVAPLLAAGVIGAVARQDLARLGRIVGVYLPVAGIGGFLAVQFTQVALAATDGLCQAVSGGFSGDAATVVNRVLNALASMRAPLASAGVMSGAASLLLIFGVVLIWLELLARSAAVYVAAMFLPLILAGLVWPATARWARRGVELLAALVLSKFVIVAVISLGASAVGQENGGLRDVMAGAALLLVAGFAPFTLLRLVPVVEAAAIGHLEGLSRRPVNAAVSTAALPSHPIIQQLRRSGGSGPMSPDLMNIGATDAPAGQAVSASLEKPAAAGGEAPLTEGWWLRDDSWPTASTRPAAGAPPAASAPPAAAPADAAPPSGRGVPGVEGPRGP
jgi:hypothetical protein